MTYCGLRFPSIFCNKFSRKLKFATANLREDKATAMRKRPTQQSLHDYFPTSKGGELEGFSFNPARQSNGQQADPPSKRQRVDLDQPPNEPNEGDAPSCSGHELPCKLMTVKKIGPNTGNCR